MDIRAELTDLGQIAALRVRFLAEIDAQVRYHATHQRGWADHYILRLGNRAIGYGAVKGADNSSDRDCLFEIYLVPEARHQLGASTSALLAASSARWIECQTNDVQTLFALTARGKEIKSGPSLFGDYVDRRLTSDAEFRLRYADDPVDPELEGDYVLVADQKIVAAGGYLTHYNAPFVDIFMATAPAHRRQGHGSYLVQEIARLCVAQGQRRAARCSADNPASRAALLKSGMRPRGVMLCARVAS